MKQTRLIMGMPVMVDLVGEFSQELLARVFDYFTGVDEQFSNYKDTSQISQINQGRLPPDKYSRQMKNILCLSEETKQQTCGYFDIRTRQGKLDPSGIVKGWAVLNAARLLKRSGVENFCIDAGGDIQFWGENSQGQSWRVGIRHPFNKSQIVKVLKIGHNEGVATSGTYERGEHIYNPKDGSPIREIVSLTVIGPNIYEADRFATAAFAMGRTGIRFIDQLDGFEGYLIDKTGIATKTSGFDRYVA